MLNPITMTKNSCGFKNLTFKVYSTIEDYDKDAGQVGAVLEHANDALLTWEGLRSWQEAFAPHVETITGKKRRVDEKATEKAKAKAKDPAAVEPTLEAESVFIAREYKAADDETKRTLEAKAQQVAETIVVSSSPTARKSKINPDDQAKADTLLASGAEVVNEKIAKWADAYGVDLSGLERDEAGLPDREAFARGISRVVEAHRQQTLAGL